MIWRRALNLLIVAAALDLLAIAMLHLYRASNLISPSRAASQTPTNKRRQKQAMALIPGATFQMGTDATEIPRLQQIFGIKREDLFAAEVPRHSVTVDSFYLDKFEVTNAQFKKFLDENPQWRRD